ncbi:MAG: hypothetical protein LV481_13950 [Methylacidiphilales bacterium]|nr:hypothetical protein [Candidatus Methylacidiphilales bacterium]
MSPPVRRSAWRPPLSLVAILTLIAFICVPLVGFSPLIPFTVAAQGLLLIIVLRGFCYSPQITGWVAGMPIPHRLVLGLLIGAMILGHFTFDKRSYFPFVAWEIFPVVRETDPVVCPELIATTSGGKKIRLLVEQLFPSIVQIDPLDNPAFYPPDRLEKLVRATAGMYDRLHPDDQIRYVDLMVMAVRLHPPLNELGTLPSCELRERYEISSAR